MKSPIEKIHDEGMVAIIDCDRQVIIGKLKPEHVQAKMSELKAKYSDVGQDQQGDIICSNDEN